MGYLDRLDFVAMPSRLSSLLSTALNHELGLGCHAGVLGALLSLLWLFEDRELLYGLLALISGCRVLPCCLARASELSAMVAIGGSHTGGFSSGDTFVSWQSH